MSKPKIIQAIDDLDYQGFYNKSTYLGDIRTDSTCLDSVLENGIYTFTGGLDKPTDTPNHGSHKWSLLVKSNQDSTSSIQIAERISGPSTYRQLPYYRYYSSGTWTEFKSELRYLAVRADANNYILIDGSNIVLSTPDGGGLYFLDEGSPGSPVLAFYGNLRDELVRLTRIAYPENDYDAANKKYADTKLPKSGGTMTGGLVLNADPTTDMQAATKKYVDDKSDPYKVGDILTTVRTDLDESWALCNGDYVDESKPIYNILPEMKYDSLEEDWLPIGQLRGRWSIEQVIDQYYLVYYNGTGGGSQYYIMKNLYDSSSKVINSAENNSVVKYNNKYLYLSSSKLMELNMSTGESTTYLSSITSGYSKLLSFNGNLLICYSSSIPTTIQYNLDSTNNILYIKGLTKIVNGSIYTFSYTGNTTLNIHRYNNGEFNLVSSVGLTIKPAVEYFCYNSGKYYILWINSKSVYMISSTDGSSFEFIGSVMLNSKYDKTISILGVLGNNIIIRASITNSSDETTYYTTRLDIIDFINSSEVAIDDNINKLTYSEDNHTVTIGSAGKVDVTNVMNAISKFYQTYCEGKKLPLLPVESYNNEYNYIKIGGNL